MSIGVCKAVSSLLTKLCERSTYDWTDAQLQQALATSVATVGVVVGGLAIDVPSVEAGTLNILNARRQEFFDWEYAKKVWFEMNTWEAEEKEWAKYSADFEPWLKIWKKGKDNAKNVLASYPEPKRSNIQRAFDIQLVWDAWYDSHYWPWFNRYKTVVQVGSAKGLMEIKSFDERRSSYNAMQAKIGKLDCSPQKFIDECGPMPDWRSPEMRAEERKLEIRRAELIGSPKVKADMKRLKDLRDALE